MRKIFYFAMVAVTAIFAGCANDEDALLPNDSLKDTPINVDVLVSGINTRAGYDNTSLPTKFYLSIDQKDTKYDYTNVVMKYDGSKWVAYESDDENAEKKQLLWEGSKDNVTVTAATFHLPEAPTSCSLNVQTDQSTADSIKASDHLYYYSNAITPSENGTISIPLNHIMSKISVKLTLGMEYKASETNPITSVSAFGASTGATYSPGAGTPWSAESNVSKITLIPSVAYNTADRTVTYEAILVPQTIAANIFGIEIRIGEKTYEWKSANAFTLTGGTNHTLEMTVGNASSANIN